MAYVALTDAETAAKALVRQALMRKIKDNFQSHEDRIVPLESNMLFFDDFVNRSDGANLSFESLEQADETLSEIVHDRDYLIVSAGTTLADTRGVIDAKPQWSVVSITTNAVASWAAVFSKRNARFDRILKPLTVGFRMKMPSDQDFRVGARVWAQANPSTDQPGLWLERVDATNYRFVSYNTARNNGTAFAKPTVNTFFLVRIDFLSGSDRAECFIDGLLKDTLTTQLPTDDILHAMFGLVTTTNTIHVDQLLLSTKGALVAP